MMGQTVEAARPSSFREPLVSRQRVCNTRKVARPEKGRNTRDIGFECQRRQIEVQFYVSVKILGDTIRFVAQRNCRRRRCRELNPALNLMDFGGVIVDDPTVRRSQFLLYGTQL